MSEKQSTLNLHQFPPAVWFIKHNLGQIINMINFKSEESEAPELDEKKNYRITTKKFSPTRGRKMKHPRPADCPHPFLPELGHERGYCKKCAKCIVEKQRRQRQKLSSNKKKSRRYSESDSDESESDISIRIPIRKRRSTRNTLLIIDESDTSSLTDSNNTNETDDSALNNAARILSCMKPSIEFIFDFS